ncbi:TlpA family protein disulfide reductase [Arenibacter aquaticus]|uniref:TlpA family protein disulfide reductase n=1 Tax=Arenibacter aquaticus TaxID=2489054 RepID=A0A3S0AXB7_9FLAO|nr:TlpA disulfide reductase family protein [Arenibacter aquaticus]RTE52488.1 TlpA family protein disulfide reductase [Arenibacter aquaticus]
MKRNVVIILLVLFLGSCANSSTERLKEGMWLAHLEVGDGQLLPFNFELNALENAGYSLEVYNADEVIHVDEIKVIKDSIVIKMPVFEGYLAGRFTAENMKGSFIKESEERVVPFTAKYGIKERFRVAEMPNTNISGNWEVGFNPVLDDPYKAKGVFKQLGDRVVGTFKTLTGDYRFLEGVLNGDSLMLSTFDGAHAYLFKSKVTDSTMDGVFYSGNHFKAQFTAKRNENFELPNADSLTFIKEGYNKLSFSFPNAQGRTVSLEDAYFKDKVVIVQIMGTWCPNCLDETKFLVEYTKQHNDNEIAVVALAFEYAKTKEAAFAAIRRLQDRIGVDYPILLAQYGSVDKELAQEKLPMLNHVLSFPTTILLDKNGEVRKIHTGFNGPATGQNYQRFKRNFHRDITGLLEE